MRERRQFAGGFVSAMIVLIIGSTVGGVALLAGCARPAQRPEVSASPREEAGLGVAPTPAVTSTPSTRSKRSTPTPATSPSTARATPVNIASRLRTLPGQTRQVIIVTASGTQTSQATLQTFAKRDGQWRPALGAMPARIGSRGFAERKIEGDLKTPTGVYGIGSTMYGIAANPGVRYRYHRLVEGDYWNENPLTAGYNTFVHGSDPGGASEALWQISPQYDHFAVINYNIPVRPADPPYGSGIFLHVMITGSPTAGCVAVARADLVRVLRWLDPEAAPRIVLSPTSQLDRY